MKITIESDDVTEIKRIAKSHDMACFIFQLKHNAWRSFKNTDYDYQIAWNRINELLEEYKIDIDDLID